MRLFFEYSEKHVDVNVYISYTNKVPSRDNNTYQAKNPLHIDIIKPISQALTNVYICVISELDTQISLKLVNKKA